ncbi:MAG: serine/threonine protein kinase [Candidatus Bruticola sp.]
MAEERRPILQGEYKLVSVIETVGDSTVYRSQSVSHSERVYAVREFKLEGYEAPEKRAMISSYFQPIAQGYMDFVDPCLTSLRDFFIENGYIYFVFDYVPGRRLSEYFRARQRPFPENLALDIAYKVAKALETLHACKPIKFFADMSISNIILASNGYVMLTDYGLGKLLADLPVDAPRMGTVGYAAPEQYGLAGIVSQATDIYGLGVLMHQLVTYIDPVLHPGKLAPIAEVNPAVSDEYIKIVRNATRTDPKKRFVSAADMAAAIRSISPNRGKSYKVLKRDLLADFIASLKAPFTTPK